MTACSDEDPAGPDKPGPEELLAPPPAGQGHQFEMITDLPGGTEAEHCMFVTAPAEGMVINRDEVRYTNGSHHFLVYETAYTEIPTAKDSGEEVDTSGVFDCSEGATNGWAIKRLIGGSQNADGTSFVSFPDDVAMTVPGGAVLLMNAHYINSSSDPLQPEVKINFWTIDEALKKHEGDILFLYNIFIRAPGMGSSTAKMRCKVHSDITIMSAQSHMHARAVGYNAQVMGDAPFYTNTKWEDVPVGTFEDGFEVNEGDTLEYWCDYDNPGAENVYQGPRSTNEMCMLIGSYYPADPATSGCVFDPTSGDEPALSLGAEWVGEGTATCAETLSCLQTALPMASMNEFDDVQDCMVDASPDIAPESSAVMGCIFHSFITGAGAFTEVCADQLAACSAK